VAERSRSGVSSSGPDWKRHEAQFCPIAKATEILGERWTNLIIRELLMGGRRFNELQRGLGDISPALLTDQRDWWLLVNGDRVELCITPPGRRCLFHHYRARHARRVDWRPDDARRAVE